MKEHESIKTPTTKQNILAGLVSIILHPVFMNIYGVALLFLYTDYRYLYNNQVSKFMYPVFIFSCIIPVIGIYLLKKGGYISSYSLDNKHERGLPFLMAFFGYLCQYIYFYNANLSFWFLSILMIPVVLVVICYFINKYWKISIHMASMGALVGSTLSICYNVKGENPFLLFIILFLLAGCLGTARLYNRKHTPPQVYFGFLVGFFVSYLTILLTVFFIITFK